MCAILCSYRFHSGDLCFDAVDLSPWGWQKHLCHWKKDCFTCRWSFKQFIKNHSRLCVQERKPSGGGGALFFEDGVGCECPQSTHASLGSKLWSLRHFNSMYRGLLDLSSVFFCDGPCNLGTEYILIGVGCPLSSAFWPAVGLCNCFYLLIKETYALKSKSGFCLNV